MTTPPVRVSAGVPTGGQFATSSHAEAEVALEAPPSPAPRKPTDREMLDNIAIMMAESQNWDADLTDDIAREIARSGRPHPGDVLTAEEQNLLDDQGEDLDEAAGRKYQGMLAKQRTEAAAAPMRVDPADTVGLLKAHAAKAEQAQRALELTAVKAIAQTVKARWPDAAYLRYAAQYDTDQDDSHFPEVILDKDFNVISGRPYLSRAGTDPAIELDALSAHLTDSGHWDDYRTIAPRDSNGYSPLLKIDEAAAIDLDELGAGAAPPAPPYGETLYTGAEQKTTGHFGNVTISPRDGKPGTIIIVDTSEGRASEPVVVMINDEIYTIDD